MFEPLVFVPVVAGVFAPIVLAAPVPVEVRVLPVVPVVLEVKLGNLEVVPAAVVPAGFVAVVPIGFGATVPVVLGAVAPVVFAGAVEPFRADVTAVLG
jgi:hypothetical protein